MMRKTITLLVALAALTATAAGARAEPAPRHAQHPALGMSQQQTQRYPAIETIYRSASKNGDQVRPLPKADRQLETLSYSHACNRLDDRRLHEGQQQRLGRHRAEGRQGGAGALWPRPRARDRWTSFSVAKSITSTLLGAAIEDGYIKSLERRDRLHPRAEGQRLRRRHHPPAADHDLGVKWNEDYSDPNPMSPRRRPGSWSPASIRSSATWALPRAEPAGHQVVYKTGETDLAGMLVSNAVGKPLAEYLSEKIWRPRHGATRPG